MKTITINKWLYPPDGVDYNDFFDKLSNIILDGLMIGLNYDRLILPSNIYNKYGLKKLAIDRIVVSIFEGSTDKIYLFDSSKFTWEGMSSIKQIESALLAQGVVKQIEL